MHNANKTFKLSWNTEQSRDINKCHRTQWGVRARDSLFLSNSCWGAEALATVLNEYIETHRDTFPVLCAHTNKSPRVAFVTVTLSDIYKEDWTYRWLQRQRSGVLDRRTHNSSLFFKSVSSFYFGIFTL